MSAAVVRSAVDAAESGPAETRARETGRRCGTRRRASPGLRELPWLAKRVDAPTEEAARAVAACRYPPSGFRSSGPVRAMHYGGANYFDEANDEILVMAMIETKEGIENLDEICATPGLDAVYIGPADLSFALGLPPRPDNPDPTHLATCDKIRDTAHKHGIKAVMHCAGAEFAAGAVKRGFDMVMLTSDLNCMVAGARAQVDAFKAEVG